MNLAAEKELFGCAKERRDVIAGSEAAFCKKRSYRSASADDSDIHKGLLPLRDGLSSGVGRFCEKNGWGNRIILFCFVNISAVGTESSSKGASSGVKKW